MSTVLLNRTDYKCRSRPCKVRLAGTVFYAASICFYQISHAMQADAQGGEVMECGRSGRRQDAQDTKTNQGAVESDDKTVIRANTFTQPDGEATQADEFKQIICSNGDVRDLPGDGGSVADGNTYISLRQCRGVVDAVPDHYDSVSSCTLQLHKFCLI